MKAESNGCAHGILVTLPGLRSGCAGDEWLSIEYQPISDVEDMQEKATWKELPSGQRLMSARVWLSLEGLVDLKGGEPFKLRARGLFSRFHSFPPSATCRACVQSDCLQT